MSTENPAVNENASTETSEEAETQAHSADRASTSGNDAAEAAASSADPAQEISAERDRLKDQLLRTAADFDNFRKRTRRELEAAEIKGKETALLELLPVVDNLERAMKAATDTTDVQSLIEGIQMVLRLFEDGARRLGIERIATVGHAFDPNVHEALQQQASSEHEAGTIIAEVQPGYVIGSRVLRAALVIVARPPSEAERQAEAESAKAQQTQQEAPEAEPTSDESDEASNGG